jgi:hypothetical protein
MKPRIRIYFFQGHSEGDLEIKLVDISSVPNPDYSGAVDYWDSTEWNLPMTEWIKQ